ncbi:MAG: hypothetical protein ABII00_10685 [Elusimicrobiota bacterium]
MLEIRRIMALSTAAAFLGCSAMFQTVQPRWPALPDAHFMHVGDYLQVTGTGTAAKPVSSETQRRSESRDAALLDAWERLGGYLEVLIVRGKGTVGDMSRGSDEFRGELDRLVYSAKVVSTQWEQGTAIVIIRLDKGRVNKTLGTDYR